MDIFNKKRVAELEKELAKAIEELHRVKQLRESDQDELTNLRAITSFEKRNMPEDCKKGPWCASCEYAKSYYRVNYDYFGRCHGVTDYACGKGEACKNFIQKEIKDD